MSSVSEASARDRRNPDSAEVYPELDIDTCLELEAQGVEKAASFCPISLETMAVSEGDQLLRQATTPKTRGLLRFIILALIAAAAVSSRLFSVIRFESIIHECTLYIFTILFFSTPCYSEEPIDR